jgi:catechol 2,3-dioxygenase-like lactoylglutathione lyase family enzyme
MPGSTLNGLGIHIKVANIEASRAFYESLGFKPVFAYGDDAFRATLPKDLGSAPERYRGMTFKIGENAELEIAEGHRGLHDKYKPGEDQDAFNEPITSPKVSAMVRVQSLVPLFSNRQVELHVPVRHYYWQSIEAAFRDPDGFVLVFIAPYSDEEFRAVSEYTTIEVVKPEDS